MAVVLAFLVSGCATPADDPPVFDCTHPTWVLGKSTSVYQGSFPRTGIGRTSEKNETLGANLLTFQDYPLDRIELDFNWEQRANRTIPRLIEVHNGTLHAAFFDSDGQPLQAYQGVDRESAKHLWSWEPGVYTNFTLTVELAPPAGIPDPGPIVVEWTFDRRPQPEGEPRDTAIMHYKSNYWYRSCTPDA